MHKDQSFHFNSNFDQIEKHCKIAVIWIPDYFVWQIIDHDKNNNVFSGAKGDVKDPLKGFLLYFEENSQIVSQEENIDDEDKVRDKCLEIWKNLSSDEKKDYKTPRVPKRKRENDEVKSTSNKLARFAAPTLS